MTPHLQYGTTMQQPTENTLKDEIEIAFALPSLPPECHSDDYVRIEQNYVDLDEVRIVLLPATATQPAMLLLGSATNGGSSVIPLSDDKYIEFVNAMPAIEPGSRTCELPNEPEKYCARIRCYKRPAGDTYQVINCEFTIKGPGRTSTGRAEANVTVGAQSVITSLMTMTEKNRIVKNRYTFAVEGREGLFWEVDNVLYPAPLIKVECELPCEGTEHPVPPASWRAVNVSSDRAYDNATIALSGNVPVYPG